MPSLAFLCSLFFAPFSFFLPLPISHREISNQDRPGSTIVNSLDLSIPCFLGALHSRPRRASLGGYCAVVRTPLHPPTTDAAVSLVFSPLQQQLASYHFSLLVPQVLAPNAVDHCLLQRVPGCSAPPGRATAFWNGWSTNARTASSFFSQDHLRQRNWQSKSA